MISRSPIAGRLVMVATTSLVLGVSAAALLMSLGWVGWFGPLTGPVAGGGWTDRSRAWFTSRGFLETGIDQQEQRQTWTGEGVRLVIPYLDRSQVHELTLTVSGGRGVDAPHPSMAVSVDGVAGPSVSIPNDFVTLPISIPASTESRAVVTFRISPTFDPGPHDDRMLGVLVRGLVLTPSSGSFQPSWSVVGALALAVAMTVAGVLLCGISGVAAGITGVAVALVFVWLLIQDGAFLGPYADSLVRLGGATLGVGLLVFVVCRRRLGTLATAPGWAIAVGLVLAGTVVKLALFSHPLITVGDGYFQVHRAHMVLGGQYFFTSVTPRPFFEFPYAVGLYVTAMPFWSAFTRSVDHVWLLRAISLIADALTGVALYAVVRRAWPGPAAFYVAGLWPFARAPFEALCNANLTNAFAQSLFGIALAGLTWMAMGGRGAVVVGLASAVVLTAAFLSHFSTFSVGIPLVMVVAASFVIGGRAETRWKGLWIAGVCVVAMAVSYAVYYRHFQQVYQQTIDRVMSQEVVETPGSSIAASPAVKLRRWATGGSDDYGLPGIPLAVAALVGVVLLARTRRREPWTLVLAGWLAIWVGFTALGIVSSVQMRVNLAAAPLFVCLGAYGVAQISHGSTSRRALSALVALLIAWDGTRLWLMCLGL